MSSPARLEVATPAASAWLPAGLFVFGAVGTLVLLVSVPLGLGLILGGALLLAVLWRPEAGLVIFFSLVPFNLAMASVLEGYLHVQPGYLSNWKDGLVLLLLVIGVVRAYQRHGFHPPRGAIVRMIVLYVAFFSAMTIFSAHFIAAGYGWARDVEGPLLFLAILGLRPSRRVIITCVTAMIAVALVMSVSALIERGPQGAFQSWYGSYRPTSTANSSWFAQFGSGDIYRSGSFLNSPLLLAFYLAAVVPVATALVDSTGPRQRVLALATTIAGVGALVFSFTRTAYIGATTGIMTAAVLTLQHWRSKVIITGFAGVALAALFAGLVTNSSLLYRPSESAAHAASVQRDITLIAARPLGYGIGTSDAVGGRFGTNYDTGGASESTYLAIGLEAGVLGLVLYPTLLFTLGASVVRARRAARRAGDRLAVMLAGAAIGAVLGLAGSDLFIGNQELVVDSVVWGVGAFALVAAGFARAPEAVPS